MAELKTRIKHKNGTPDEWSQATNFSPLKGELVVYNDATNPKMKIGDGETNVNDLPFINNTFTYDQITMPDGNKWNGVAGANVIIEPTITSGTKLATVSVDGVSKDLYYQASAVTLNGSATTSASFYAPTSAGTTGQVLTSKGSGVSPSWANVSWLPLSGGTLSGPLTLKWAASATMDSTTTGPRIIFDQATEGQRVAIVYTSYNEYRAPAGLKVIGLDTDSSPAWFEVEGKVFATEFSGSGASLTSLNASNISSGTIAAARLPAATSSALGGVKVGSNITVSSGTISLTKDNITTALGYTPPTTNTTYSNFVKSGSGAKAGLVPAPSTTAGTTKYLREDGTWAVPPDTDTVYTLPKATSSILGGVKVGSNITVSSGTISLTKANVTAALGYTPPTSDTNTTYTFTTGDSNGQIKVVASTGSSANVAVKGLGSNAYTSTAYLPLAGGTLTGDITISKSTTIANNTPIAINFKMTQTDNNVSSTSYIRVYDDLDDSGNGNNMVIASMSGTYLCAGEGGSSYLANNASTGENVHICADKQIYFHANCNTVANATSTCYISTTGVLYGAAWNDYAEFRAQFEEVKPGYIVYSEDDGKLRVTTERLQKYEGVVSDTYGFAIGETDECKTPIAVSGRALVYCDPEEEHFHSGDCVCAGPNGLAYRMTREEVIEFPDRIVGVVSEIPTYKTWGTGNVEVNGRIWIKVK